MVAGALLALVPQGAYAARALPLGAVLAGARAACPWVESTASPDQRADQVLAQMTVPEEVALVHGTSGPYVGNVAANPRLCIPALSLQDGPNGVGDGMTGVTQLPALIAGAASWDTALAKQYGSALGAEMAGKGVNIELGPTVNLARDPRWGRTFETQGEDPYLAGAMGAANIKGVQSQRVMAQVKHLAAYSSDDNRNKVDARVDERTEQELYLAPFQDAVKAGVSSVMCATNYVNGNASCADPYAQNAVLKKQFGSPGFITSDWAATYSTAASANNGLDMEMPDGQYFGSLATAVQNGQVPKSRLDDMVHRILRQMFAFGLFDTASPGSPDATVTSEAHKTTARRASEEGTVLLKNAGSVLPLGASAQVKSVAVIGQDAGSGALSVGGGSAQVIPSSVVTPYQGIADRAGKAGISTEYAEGPTNDGSLPTVPGSVLTPSTGGGNGLTGQFYPNKDLSGTPAVTRTDAVVDFNWYRNSPASGIGTTGWSAKWTGSLKAPTSGTYTFSLTSDDGARLLVNGQPVINDWSDHASHTATGTVSLTAGQSAKIEVDYYQNDGDSNLTLGWQPPSTTALQQAVNAAHSSDVAVVFAGFTEKENGDLKTIDLSANDNQLISAVAAANPRTIVVLNTGSPVTMPWLKQVAGVFEAWYPGQENGNAIAALLFGDVNPSGKLPVTFPNSLTDIPTSTQAQWPGADGQIQYSEGLKVGYRWYDAQDITPQFPFGFGLSYTTFSYSGLSVTGPDSSGNVQVSATVTNNGTRAGDDVVQLYLAAPAAAGEPAKQLKGFTRVRLAASAGTRVHFTLSERDASVWNTTSHSWSLTHGTYQVMVGGSSRNLPLTGTFARTGTGYGQITGIAGKCDDFAAGTANSNPIQLYDCNNTAAQTFTVMPDHTLRVLGKCVEVQYGATGNGAPVQLYDCNGTGAQQWRAGPNGSLVNPQSGRCLDVPSASTANGTQLRIYDCNATDAQKWRLP
ncbi:glycoside hydrolase family 3 C-terminal domain-containing protein [Actinoallomurus acanthiterrae]